MLRPFGIKEPFVSIEPHHHAGRYVVGQSWLKFTGCVSDDIVAHELGHYVLDRANGFNWGRHAADTLAAFCLDPQEGRCRGGWVKAREASPGVEHAAHCVGFVLHRTATYTKCPHEELVEAARERLRRAR